MLITGTQADTDSNNEILVMKMGGMHRTQHDDGEDPSAPPPPPYCVSYSLGQRSDSFICLFRRI